MPQGILLGHRNKEKHRKEARAVDGTQDHGGVSLYQMCLGQILSCLCMPNES